MYAKKEEIYPAYVLKHNWIHEEQVILSIISNGQKRKTITEGWLWHCLAVKKLSALLRKITPKNNDDFDCLNCLQSRRTENKLNRIKEYVKIKAFVTL